MSKKKKKKKKAARQGRRSKASVAAVRKTRKPSSKGKVDADRDKKVQQQYYVTQDLIDGIEELRVVCQDELRGKLGRHVDLSTSQFVGSVLHELVLKAQGKKR